MPLSLSMSLMLDVERVAPVAFSLDFTPGTLPGGVTASGATNGTRVNASGSIAATTAPRFDYSATSVGTIRGLLVEATATNLQLQSEDFSAAHWTKTDTTITADATTAPTGGATADLCTEGVAGTASVKSANIGVTPSVQYTYSIYVKPGNIQWVRIQGSNGAGNIILACFFDVVNFVVGTTVLTGSPTNTSVAIENAGGGWARITLSATWGASGTLNLTVQSATADNNATRVANGTYSLWGGQLEQKNAPASTYVGPVLAAGVTRTAESVGFTLPAGVTSLTYTFDDNSTQQTTGLSPGAFTIPTTLNRARIRTIASP